MEDLIIEIFETEFDNQNTEGESKLKSEVSDTKSQRIVYEAEKTALYKGVTNCNDTRDKQAVEKVAKDFAEQKKKETGYNLIQYGWRGYNAQHRSGRDPWPDNSRWCRSFITVQCYAIFDK